MAAVLHHRGPDAQGVWAMGAAGLAHARLSIIDLEGGAQPMQTPDKNLILSFNGEIFNYLELREQLQGKGYCFTTNSDTEVILYLYREYGRDFPKYCNGQFAIALWDHCAEKLVLVRDRLGICPLYYTIDDQKFIFASEIKALRPALSQSLTLNIQALDQLFTGWTCLPPDTIFHNVKQVLPGQLLEIGLDKAIKMHCYWDFEFPCHVEDIDRREESVLIEELHEHLLNATRLRMRADVPVGAYLSGGLDSSVLTALMAQRTDANIHTFSLGFSDPALDETRFQAQMVSHLGTRHQQIKVDASQIAASLPKTIWHTESPILRTAPAPMGLLSELAHDKGYKVVLTGEGADEILGGYDVFKEAKVRQFWARQPDSSWRALLLKRLYPYLELPKNNEGLYLKKFFGVGLETPELLWHSHLPRWQTTAKAKLFFSDPIKQQLNSLPNYEQQLANILPSSADDWHWFNRAQYIEIKTLMAGYLLTSQGDRMLSRNSVEGRFPFLDHHLIEFANRLPVTMKMKGLKEKYLLKKMAEHYLPKLIRSRPKQPYRAPDVAALTHPAIPAYVYDLLSYESIQKAGFFNAGAVEKLLKKLAAGRVTSQSDSQALVGIITTQLCHQLFVENMHFKGYHQ